MGVIDDLLIERLNNNCKNAKGLNDSKNEFERIIKEIFNLSENEKNQGEIKEIKDEDGNVNGFEFTSNNKETGKDGVSEFEKRLLFHFENKDKEFDFSHIKDFDFLNSMIDIFERYTDEKEGVEHKKVFSSEDAKPLTFDDVYKELNDDLFKKTDINSLAETRNFLSNLMEGLMIDAEKKHKKKEEEKKNEAKEEKACCEEEKCTCDDVCDCEEPSPVLTKAKGPEDFITHDEYVRLWTPHWENEVYFINAVAALLDRTFFSGKKIKLGLPKMGETIVIMLNDREKLTAPIRNWCSELINNGTKLYTISPSTLELRRILNENDLEDYKMHQVYEDVVKYRK